MVGSNDLVMGSGTFTPDTLNRLSSATNLPVSSSATNYYCWSYDSFGNRSLQGVSTAAFASGPPACTPQSSASYEGVWAHIASNNRFSNTQQAMAGVAYDGAGNILNDGVDRPGTDEKLPRDKVTSRKGAAVKYPRQLLRIAGPSLNSRQVLKARRHGYQRIVEKLSTRFQNLTTVGLAHVSAVFTTTALFGLAPLRSTRASAAHHRESISACRPDVRCSKP